MKTMDFSFGPLRQNSQKSLQQTSNVNETKTIEMTTSNTFQTFTPKAKEIIIGFNCSLNSSNIIIQTLSFPKLGPKKRKTNGSIFKSNSWLNTSYYEKLIQQSTEKIINYQIGQFIKTAKTALKNANNLRKSQKLINIIDQLNNVINSDQIMTTTSELARLKNKIDHLTSMMAKKNTAINVVKIAENPKTTKLAISANSANSANKLPTWASVAATGDAHGDKATWKTVNYAKQAKPIKPKQDNKNRRLVITLQDPNAKFDPFEARNAVNQALKNVNINVQISTFAKSITNKNDIMTVISSYTSNDLLNNKQH